MVRKFVWAMVIAASSALPAVNFTAHSMESAPSTRVAQCQPGYYPNSSGNCVEKPDQSPTGATAICCDGTESHSQSRSGTCSRHGGVCHWNGFEPGYFDSPRRRSA